MTLNPELERATAHIVVIDGVSVHFHDHGSGEPVLLFPGWGPQPGMTAWITWRDVISELAQYYRVIAIDLPNYGRTGPVIEEGFAYRLGSDLAAGLLRYLDIGSVHVVGTSTGGSSAFVFAQDHPELTRSLVIGSSHVPDPTFRNLLAPAPEEGVWAGIAYELAPTADNLRMFVRTLFHDPTHASDELIAELERVADAAPDHLAAFQASTGFAKEPRLARTISVPALVISGREDRVVPIEHTLGFLAHLDDAEAVILKGVGHLPTIEAPDRYASHLLRFLRHVDRPHTPQTSGITAGDGGIDG
ncbi:alpha/beta fold hydrolase [Microbacterium atlanticum]|uniref:alpha/beta fold hydrolase n=1 Tax=Microbacterium atlanticum TaxID=2782168 RepID=UPI001887346D|nr:alpha/beta hydrolase [Microbacterium atlanticum]